MNSRNGSIFYWCTAMSTLLMFSFVPLVWFKKIWDYMKPVHDYDASLTVPPVNRILRKLYEFSFEIMSNAIFRTIIYLLVVVILVIVSLLHLVSRIN
jgi:hypothetical protein